MSKEVLVEKRESLVQFRSPQYQYLYVNRTQAAFSQWDIQLHLSHLSEIEPGVPGIEQLAMIVMSPAHAKAMLTILETTIAQFERNFGPITLSPESFQVSTPETAEEKSGPKSRSKK